MYEADKELQKVLANNDVANFTVEDKFHLIEAYMANGAAGLEIQMEGEESEIDEKALEEMSAEEK